MRSSGAGAGAGAGASTGSSSSLAGKSKPVDAAVVEFRMNLDGKPMIHEFGGFLTSDFSDQALVSDLTISEVVVSRLLKSFNKVVIIRFEDLARCIGEFSSYLSQSFIEANRLKLSYRFIGDFCSEEGLLSDDAIVFPEYHTAEAAENFSPEVIQAYLKSKKHTCSVFSANPVLGMLCTKENCAVLTPEDQRPTTLIFDHTSLQGSVSNPRYDIGEEFACDYVYLKCARSSKGEGVAKIPKDKLNLTLKSLAYEAEEFPGDFDEACKDELIKIRAELFSGTQGVVVQAEIKSKNLPVSTKGGVAGGGLFNVGYRALLLFDSKGEVVDALALSSRVPLLAVGEKYDSAADKAVSAARRALLDDPGLVEDIVESQVYNEKEGRWTLHSPMLKLGLKADIDSKVKDALDSICASINSSFIPNLLRSQAGEAMNLLVAKCPSKFNQRDALKRMLWSDAYFFMPSAFEIDFFHKLKKVPERLLLWMLGEFSKLPASYVDEPLKIDLVRWSVIFLVYLIEGKLVRGSCPRSDILRIAKSVKKENIFFASIINKIIYRLENGKEYTGKLKSLVLAASDEMVEKKYGDALSTLKTLEGNYLPYSDQLARCFYNQATSYARLGQYTNAEKFCKKSLVIRGIRADLSEDHLPDYEKTYDKLERILAVIEVKIKYGQFLSFLERSSWGDEKILEEYERYVKIYQEIQPESKAELQEVYRVLAEKCASLELRIEDAKNYAEKRVQICGELYPEGHVTLVGAKAVLTELESLASREVSSVSLAPS